jgi:hypothetical protein
MLIHQEGGERDACRHVPGVEVHGTSQRRLGRGSVTTGELRFPENPMGNGARRVLLDGRGGET